VHERKRHESFKKSIHRPPDRFPGRRNRSLPFPGGGKSAIGHGAPQDAFIRADVKDSTIDLKVIDIKGNTLDSFRLPVRSKRQPSGNGTLI